MARSSLLIVAVQLALLALLLASTPLRAGALAQGLPPWLLAAGVAVGLAALAVNRPGNFNVVPEVRSGARLVTGGIYRWVRHPIYLSVLLFTAGAVAAEPLPWRLAAWVALLAVLQLKMRREEGFLRAAFPGYADYAARTARLLPRVY